MHDRLKFFREVLALPLDDQQQPLEDQKAA